MKKMLSIVIITFIFLSCKKTSFDVEKNAATLNGTDSTNTLQARTENENMVCDDCAALETSYTDTMDNSTVLGNDILNPYTLPNMNQAYYNIYGGYPSPALPVTHLYVKFSPTSLTQLATLEDEDIDLTTFPLDKEVIFEGDYYLQPGKAIEDLPDLWAVVPANYTFVTGIPYTVITEMYIPDNAPIIEDEALYLTGNLGDDPTNITSQNSNYNYLNARAQRIANLSREDCDCICPDPTRECLLPSHCFDPISPCAGTGGGGGGGGGGSTNCRHYPIGKIVVQNNLATDFGYRGVRNVRVVIRRTFKVERVFTDNNGIFASTKYFRNKYTILTKFKNQYARIGRMRPWAIWEQYFPIKINFGRWSNLPCNYEFAINNPSATGTIKTSHWAAATAHNAVIEHREMSQQEGVGVAPQKLHILLSRKRNANNGNTYMTNKILASGGIVPYALLTNAAASLVGLIPVAGAPLAPLVVAVAALWAVRAPDMVLGYGGNFTSFLATDQYCELAYHELTHAAHYAQVGNAWYIAFGLDEYQNPGTGSYGACCQTSSQKIVVGESWAYHMGQYLANKKWGLECTTFPEQGSDISNFENTIDFSAGGGKSSKENFLEDFNPNRPLNLDPNRWLAKGLFYDMIDSGIESPNSQISADNVSGFTNQQFYQALQNDVNSMSDYKAKFLQQNNFIQQTQINEIFSQYEY